MMTWVWLEAEQVIRKPETCRKAEEDSKSYHLDTQNTRQEQSRAKYRI